MDCQEAEWSDERVGFGGRFDRDDENGDGAGSLELVAVVDLEESLDIEERLDDPDRRIDRIGEGKCGCLVQSAR